MGTNLPKPNKLFMIEIPLRNPDDEKALLIRLSQGDKLAFKIIYDTYKRRITANVLGLLKSKELSKELVQDLFLKIWEKRADIDPEKSFSAYLFRIAGNMIIDSFRRAARDRKMQEKIILASTELYSHIEEAIFYKQDHALLEHAISLMPSQRRKVYRLCKLEGKSYKEVGLIMGIGPKTINSHLYQASLFLKKHFTAGPPLALALLLRSVFKGI